MALSPQYSWPEPDNSSLVKNGAQDIRALGDAIDTSVWNVGYGQAGKNKIINGDFSVNQRSFTSTTTSGTYGFDRWTTQLTDGTSTYSAQTFTPGAAPVAGYEGTNFARLVSTGQTLTTAQTRLRQLIEDVRTFADQSVTVSFWAKASTGTPNIAVNVGQSFGSGGSSSVVVNGQKFAITNAWVRYSKTFIVPSINGKTIGTSSNFFVNLWTSAGSDRNTDTDSLGIQSVTVDFWGVQVEYGSKATPFQTATGTIQGELAACQRYYFRYTPDSNVRAMGQGTAISTTLALINVPYPVPMRITPTALEQSGTAANYVTMNAAAGQNALTVVPAFDAITTNRLGIILTTSAGLVAGNSTYLFSASTSGYLGWSAEL